MNSNFFYNLKKVHKNPKFFQYFEKTLVNFNYLSIQPLINSTPSQNPFL